MKCTSTRRSTTTLTRTSNATASTSAWRISHRERAPADQARGRGQRREAVRLRLLRRLRWDPAPGLARHGPRRPSTPSSSTVFFDHLKTKYGITPDALEIVLEPENTSDWNDGAQVGPGAVAAAARLEAAGYTPQFIAPSTVSASQRRPVLQRRDHRQRRREPLLDAVVSPLSLRRLRGHLPGGTRAGVQTGMLEFFTASVDDLVQDSDRRERLGLGEVRHRVAEVEQRLRLPLRGRRAMPANPVVTSAPRRADDAVLPVRVSARPRARRAARAASPRSPSSTRTARTCSW